MQVGGYNVNNLLYADDLVLIAENAKKIKKCWIL